MGKSKVKGDALVCKREGKVMAKRVRKDSTTNIGVSFLEGRGEESSGTK
jgi:hypothetical protein